LKNNKITLGLTGGIAIYKSVTLLRRLIQDYGADVTVIMTAAAQKFMQPLIFETLSGKPVITEMFAHEKVFTRHIDLGKAVDLVLVSPATANIVAKAAHGIADDMLSTVILTAGNKTVFALAMNEKMYLNPMTQENIAKLKNLGYGFIEPEVGDLACREVGIGRLAEESVILNYLEQRLHGTRLLEGQKVLVTAGPTREYLDTVRFISNRSSGKMGYALAIEAQKEGAEVILISGPTSLSAPKGIKTLPVESAQEMHDALLANADKANYLFMAAAVEDLVPDEKFLTKLKKSQFPATLRIKTAPDLIQSFRQQHRNCCIVGFSVEIEEGKTRSLEKLRAKGMDFIAWNDPSQVGAGFGAETNILTLFAADGEEWHFPLADKREIARQIISCVVQHRSKK
jgi:phosphopantothenoylcysteine decarboxylase/phosphopantothenate--cysteine ligase